MSRRADLALRQPAIDEREYRADYSLPRLGDFAVLQVKGEQNLPDVALAGLFDESWRLPEKLGTE